MDVQTAIQSTGGTGPFASILTVKAINKTIVTMGRLPPNALVSRCRSREYVAARHVAICLCLRHTRKSTTEIGRLFDRDHSTVVNARKKTWWVIDRIEPQMNEESTLQDWCRAAWRTYRSGKCNG